MTDYLKGLWARLLIRWHVLSLALLAAAPEILNYLGVIDLKPILSQFLPDNSVDLVVGIMPFVLMFVKSVVAVEPPSEDE